MHCILHRDTSLAAMANSFHNFLLYSELRRQLVCLWPALSNHSVSVLMIHLHILRALCFDFPLKSGTLLCRVLYVCRALVSWCPPYSNSAVPYAISTLSPPPGTTSVSVCRGKSANVSVSVLISIFINNHLNAMNCNTMRCTWSYFPWIFLHSFLFMLFLFYYFYFYFYLYSFVVLMLMLLLLLLWL